MTEAALLTACMLGGQIGMVVFGKRVLPLYQELVASYGLAGRMAAWRAIESAAPYSPGTSDALDRLLVQTALDLVEAGAETVILAGAVMAGVPTRLQSAVPVPLLDGISCGVRQAELLVRMAPVKPTRGSYASPGAREIIAVDDALAQRFKGGA
jgi:allantoin racemase